MDPIRETEMKISKLALKFIIATVMIPSGGAQSMDPTKIIPKSNKVEISNINLGQINKYCPGIDDLKKFVPEINTKNLKKSPEQGGNSTVYFSNDSVIKISRIVEKYDENSESNKALRANEDINKLKNPVFRFYSPSTVYQIISPDRQRVCDVQIMPKARGEKLNRFVYKYVDPIDDDGHPINTIGFLAIFEKLGMTLAQFQTNNLEGDEGPQHGDFHVGNIFYDKENNTFSLIDLSDFKKKGHLILDPVYFVYFLPSLWGPPKSNQEFFRHRYDDLFHHRIRDIIYSFFKGYVLNLPKNINEKMSEYLNTTKNPGFSAFGLNTKARKLYGQNLQNIESMTILEPLIKDAFVTARNIKYEGTKLDLKPSIQVSTGKEAIKSLRDVPNLYTINTKELDLQDYINLVDLTGIRKCHHLKTLNLKGTKISNVEEIGNLCNLEELDLSTTNVGWVLPIAGYKVVKEVRIRDGKGCQKLRILKLNSIQEIYGLAELKENIPNLRHIETKDSLIIN